MEQAHDVVCAIERARDLLDVQVDGWSIWPLLRRGVSGRLTSGPSLTVTAGTRLRQLAPAAPDPWRILRQRHARYVAKTYTSALRDTRDGLYRDIYFDDVLDGLRDYYKIETVNNPAFVPRRRRASIPSDLTTGVLDVATKLSSRFRRVVAVEQATDEMASRLADVLHPEIFPAWRIRGRVADFFWLKTFYGRLFDRLTPELVLTADIGDFGMVAAARERGVRVCEMQHGIFPRCHSAYSWTDYATPYRDQMPLPNDLLVYGDYWRDELESGGFWGDGLRVVGSPQMDRYRIQAEERAARRTSALSATTDLPLIVWTTQGVDVSRVAAFLRDFVGLLPPAGRYQLIVKLHPTYDQAHRATYEAAVAGIEGVQVVGGNESPATFDLLARAQAHVSVSSTCHYDALGMGVPTVIIPLVNHEIVMPLANKGFAVAVRDPRDMAEQMPTLLAQGSGVSHAIREQLYRHDAVRNIHRVVHGVTS